MKSYKLVITIAAILMASNANAVCFFAGERTSGMNKICYYDCLEGTRAITIGALDMCPMTLYAQVKRDIMGIPFRGCGA